MKISITLSNRNRFLVFMSICALIFVQASNGMMQSKKHYNINFNRAQTAKAKSMKDPVWVKTTDGRIVPIEKWKIDQMKLLQVILEDQDGANSRQNPIVKPKVYKNDQWITLQELKLVGSALDAASAGQFEEFYKEKVSVLGDAASKGLSKEDILRLLISAAGKVEATGISALCGTYFLLPEMQQLVVKDMMQPVVEYIKRNNIQETPLAFGQTTIRSVAFSLDGTKIAAGSWSGDCGVTILDAYTGKIIRKLLPANSKVTSVAFSHDGTKIVIGCHVGEKLTIWDVQSGQKLLAIPYNWGVRAVAFNVDDTRVVSGAINGVDSIVAWNVQDGTKVWETVGYHLSINSLILSQDGTKIISGSMGNQDNLRMWNANDGSLLHNFVGIPSSVYLVALSPDGAQLVCGINNDQDNIVVLDIATGNQLYSLKGSPHTVNSLAFSPDGTQMVCGGDKGSLSLWNVQSREKIADLVGHTGTVGTVAFSPDGLHIASGGKQLLLWDFSLDLLEVIGSDLTLEQARLFYQMYCAAESSEDILLKKDTIEYKAYETFSDAVKRQICRIFPVMLEECTIEEQHENSTCCIS